MTNFDDISNLYNSLIELDPSFKTDVSFDQFNEDIKDSEYLSNLNSLIKDTDPPKKTKYEDKILYIDEGSKITPDIQTTAKGNFYTTIDDKNYKVIRTDDKSKINFNPTDAFKDVEQIEEADLIDTYAKDIKAAEERAKTIEGQDITKLETPQWEKLGYENANEYYKYIADEDEGSKIAYKSIFPIAYTLDKQMRFVRGLAQFPKGAKDLYDMGEQILIGGTLDILNVPERVKKERLRKLTLKQEESDKPIENAIANMGELIMDYEGENITDALGKGNKLQAVDMAIGGMAEGLPSLLLAATGWGGISVLGSTAAGNKFDEILQENPEEALSTLTLNALGTGITEAAFELVTRGILKKARNFIGQGNKEAADALIQSYGRQMFNKLAVDPTKEGLSEAATGFVTELIDWASLDKVNYDDFSEFWNKNINNWIDEGIIGFGLGGGVSAASALGSNKASIRNAAETILTPASDKQVLNDAAVNINNLNKQIRDVNQSDATDKASQVEILEVKIIQEEAKIINTKAKVSQELNNMTPTELRTYANGMEQIAKKKRNLNSASPEVVKESKTEIETLETENNRLIRESTNRRIQENVKKVQKVAEKLGVTVENLKTPSEFQKAYDKTETGKKNSMNVTSASAFYDSNGNIYINETVAAETKSVNDAEHEVLHAVLKNSFTEPGQLNKVIKEFKSVLPVDQAAMIQKRIDENYRYEKFDSKDKITTPEENIKNIKESEDGKVVVELKEDVYNEEYLTAFADLIGNGQIKFNDNIFTKIGNFFTPIFRTKGYNHIKFDTGQDVYNFVKDYQKQIKKGELSPEVLDVAEKGVTGELLKVEEVVEKVDEKIEKDEIKFSKAEITDLAKQYKKDPANTDVEELIKQYDNVALKALGYDISKGTIAPEEAISFVNKEFDSILKRYDGSTEFSTWINSNIRPKRQAFYDEQIGKEAETTSIDSEQARQVVDDAEIAIDDRTEKEIRQAERKIKVAKRLNLEDKAIKEVSKKVKDIDLSKVNYKTLKNLANETIGEAFGISPKKILSNANLTKSEIANAQRYIKTNIDLLKALLPDGYNKDFKSTGVPKVLLDKFYNKRSVRAKTGAGLNIQVKKPNITDKEFLEVFGFVDGKPTRDDRNISARIIALANQTGKAITNQTVREQLQKEGMPESALQDIKSGTPSVMFSKNKFTENEISKLKDAAQWKDKREIAKNLDFNSDAINESNRETLQAQILKAAEQGFIDKAVIEAGAMGSGGRQTFYGNENTKFRRYWQAEEAGIENIGKYFKTKNDKYYRFGDAKVVNKKVVVENKSKYKDQIASVNPKLWVAKPGRLFWGTKDPAYETLLETANDSLFDENGYRQISISKKGKFIGKKALVQKLDKKVGDTDKTQSEINMDMLDHVVNQLAKAVDNGMSMDVAGMVIIQSYQATGGLIKAAAPFKGVSDVFEAGKKLEIRSKKLYREEHNPPASVVGASILTAIKVNKPKAVMSDIRKNFSQTILSKKDDSKLDVKYPATLPKGSYIGNDPIVRMAMSDINLNNISYIKKDQTYADAYDLGVPESIQEFPNVFNYQNKLIKEVEIGNEVDGKLIKKPLSDAKKELAVYGKFPDNGEPSLAKTQNDATNFTSTELKESKVLNIEEDLDIEELIGKAKTIDESLKIANSLNQPVKKIRVFDFDDTLAITESEVLYTSPDGEEGSLSAEKFATDGARLLEEGYVFDFTEFDKVTKGKPGPLLDIAKKIQEARGTEDVFVLTARAPEAAIAIKEFLDSQDLKIPLKNITGLGKSTGEAKANWMIDKAAEGYNDFYFADDAYQNVKAVKDVMSVIDVKSKVQQARVKFSKDLSEDFNKLIEKTTGTEFYKEYSPAKAKVIGASKGKFKFFIPHSAEDFLGLIYPTLSKGNVGDQQMAWYKKHLLNPYTKAMENLSASRLNLMQDFKQLKKSLDVPKDLRKKNESGFTNEQAVRVWLFNQTGNEVPGISKKDLKELIDIVEKDPKLITFATQMLTITKGDGYASPRDTWLTGTITTDLIDLINTEKRSKYLSEWQENVDAIYSKTNLNKLEALYGTNYVDALTNVLSRMKSGRNRLETGNRLSNRILDYINGSIGTIMFFNTRSALLQTISSINFINWNFNNPIKAGAAFANQKQYWKDFKTLMNSDYLVDRRNGLKLNISESEIADAAATSKNKAKAALNWLLQKGYLPTQYADSFAIASGGATYYRNRIKDLIKNEGKSEKEAEEQALVEWRQVSEESQQSADPARISAQQSSDLGRIILAFANTPMQYARIQKRAIQDLINRRGDAKTHISKVIYYGFIQNVIFNALQQAVFALGFGDDDEDNREEKYLNVANGMLDSLLRGLGIAGAAISVGKNFLKDLYERSNRPRPEYVDAVWKLTQFSPPINSKIAKLKQAAWHFDSKKRRNEIFEKGFALDNPAYEAFGKTISATTNIPLDRAFYKIKNIEGALNEDNELWQRLAMLGGWPEWQLKSKPKKSSKIKEEVKLTKEQEYTKLNKADQVKKLEEQGVPKDSIKNLKYEKDRVKELIKLDKETKEEKDKRIKSYKPSSVIKSRKVKLTQRAKDSIKYKKLRKPEQVRMLDSLGLSKKDIRELQYEKNRVKKLLELMEK